MITYRPDQVDIINYKKGKMSIQAVPGAGKTFIMTHLATKLIKEKEVGKQKILILSYMNSAYENFDIRIKRFLKEENISAKNKFDSMTIHSLAFKIIKEKPELLNISDEVEIMDEYQQLKIIKKIVDSLNFEYNDYLNEKAGEKTISDWQDKFLTLVKSTISKIKYTNLCKDNITGEFLPFIYMVYEQYERELNSNGKLDYDDLLVLAYKLLVENEELRNIFKKRYKYIFEDECQDSNEIQGKIVKLICSGNLVRVGDINQSITGTFSNSNPKFFKSFIEETKEHKQNFTMNMSNRSSKEILKKANKLVQNSYLNYPNSLENVIIDTVPTNKGFKENPKGVIITMKKYTISEDELEKNIQKVLLLSQKYKDKTIGILFPTIKQVSEASKILNAKEIPHNLIGHKNIDNKVVCDLYKLIDFLIDCTNINKLINVLENVFFKREGKKFDDSLSEFLSSIERVTTIDLIYGEINKDIKENVYYEYLDNYIKIIQSILEFDDLSIQNLILFIKEKLKLKHFEKSVLDYIIYYIKFINPSIDTLEKYLELSKDSKHTLFNRVIEINANFLENEDDHQITVCNHHKSKGLEWDIVFLIGVTDYNFPKKNSKTFSCEPYYLKPNFKNPDAVIDYEIDLSINGASDLNKFFKDAETELINEKLRLLYVLITRAKESLYLSYSTFNSEKQKSAAEKHGYDLSQNLSIHVENLKE